MFNNIKYFLNKKLNTHFNVEVIVSTPSHTASNALLSGRIEKDQLILLSSYNKVKYLICNDFIKIGSVYHLDTPEGIFLIRIL